MMTNAETYFKQARLYSDDRPYQLVGLPAAAITPAAAVLAETGEAFSALLVDKDEVTLVLPEDAVAQFSGRLREARLSAPYRLITLDVELPPELVGFMAGITEKLAAAAIPVIALGAFSRDHLLVPASHFEQAWQLLEAAQKA